MTLDEIRQKKKQYGYTNEQMAALSGLPLSTVQKVLGGTTKAPRGRTLAALAAVFPAEHRPVSYTDDAPLPVSRLAEPSAAAVRRLTSAAGWPRQGSYTLADYLALPDDVRVELIDGVFYDMSAPSTPHQLFSGHVYAELLHFVRARCGTCLPFIAPTDVQLDCDDRTILQPDVMILCDRSRLTYNRIFGAPDFVMEVLSPSTCAKDILVKTRKYALAGVREYWIVDPQHETVTTYLFSPAEKPESGTGPVNPQLVPDGPEIAIYGYSFVETVPVGVFNGECGICFADIVREYDIGGIPR